MFDAFLNRIRHLEPLEYILIVMALAVQIQITLFAHGDYLGLRIGLADLFVPFTGLYVLYTLLTGRSKWPRWSVKKMMYGLAALVFVMSAALLNSYVVNNGLSSWALVNKYTGFFLLLAYLMLGGWIASNAQNTKRVLSLFAGVFTGFVVLSMALSVVFLFLQFFIPYPLWLADYPWDGFMANRNAFMAIFVLAFVFIIWSYADNEIYIPETLRRLFWLCLPVFFIFNDSRTGWLVSIALMIILLLKDPVLRIKKIALPLLIGAVIAYGSYYITTKATMFVLEGAQMKYLIKVVTKETGEDLAYIGDQKRFIAVEDGLELYHQHNPLIGAGLGSYKPFQIAKRGEFIDVMDFTALWLLVETGAVGLLVFASFFMMCVWALYKTGFAQKNSAYHRAMFTFLVLFACMSVLHELMYTRVLWLAMGLALAVPYGKRRSPPL
ncbi:MAG: O-antigen ligase family protein [Alphaproteobacteria bacterium]|nr:O-antigen ligase family protein [Alphaproteobacteria bacterium]